jgi:hypothetical protein
VKLEPTFPDEELILSLVRVKEKTGELWTPLFVMHKIMDGSAGLFHLVEDGKHYGYLVVERYVQGSDPWMNVWILEGTGLDRFDDCLPLIDDLARSIGASSWRCIGRNGWAKYLKPVATVFERKLI